MMKSAPAISVALSVLNGERFLAGAIESVLVQSCGDFEFLILDDGSTDATRAIIERYAAGDRRIKPIIRENRGLIASLNELLERAQAPIVARMDADDICHPARFEKQLGFLEAHPGHGAVGCWNNHMDEHGSECVVDGPDHPTSHEGIILAIRGGQTPLSHPTVMYRRDVVRAVGGYRGAFRHCEDLDLWLRLSEHTMLANLPERLLHYRRHEGQVSSRYVIEQQFGAAVARLAWHQRQLGRPDPTEGLTVLPPLDELDALFGQPGVAKALRAQLTRSLSQSTAADADEALAIITQHLRDGGASSGLWRTVARLAFLGSMGRSARLAKTLAITASKRKLAESRNRSERG